MPKCEFLSGIWPKCLRSNINHIKRTIVPYSGCNICKRNQFESTIPWVPQETTCFDAASELHPQWWSPVNERPTIETMEASKHWFTLQKSTVTLLILGSPRCCHFKWSGCWYLLSNWSIVACSLVNLRHSSTLYSSTRRTIYSRQVRIICHDFSRIKTAWLNELYIYNHKMLLFLGHWMFYLKNLEYRVWMQPSFSQQTPQDIGPCRFGLSSILAPPKVHGDCHRLPCGVHRRSDHQRTIPIPAVVEIHKFTHRTPSGFVH